MAMQGDSLTILLNQDSYQDLLTYTTFTLQVVYPMVLGVGQNAPVLQLSHDVHMQTCETVAHYPNP